MKDQIAAALPVGVKEDLKRILRELHMYKPRPEQLFLEHIIKTSKSTFLIQIGANDGLDFVRSVIRRFWRQRAVSALLIEPQIFFYRQLLGNYAGVAGVETLNVAISDEAKTATLYHVDYENTTVPGWAKGLGSFSRDVLLSHRAYIADLEHAIRAVEVQCVSAAELLAKANGRQLDVLITDTEGHDYVILQQFDFDRVRPKLVVFESKHLAPAELAQCEAMLAARGYRVLDLHNDNSIALRADVADAALRAVFTNADAGRSTL